MKFINYLTSIAGIEIYPLISLVLFFGIFSTVLWITFRTSREEIREQGRIPLD